MRFLIVVDMQNDFVTGSLGTKEAQAIVPAVVKRIQNAAASGDEILFTLDTHSSDYLSTQEGRLLPVSHCIKGTEGHHLIPEIQTLSSGCKCFEKGTFGSEQLADYLRQSRAEEIELIGLCTDICVISNALLIKAYLPEARISVTAGCCAGVTPESHDNALAAMKMCQIQIQ